MKSENTTTANAGKKNPTGVEPIKLALGELVTFDDVLVTPCFTQFGESVIVSFAKNDTVIRKCYAQGGMLEFLKQNPDTRSIVLKKKIKDGDRAHNVWARN